MSFDCAMNLTKEEKEWLKGKQQVEDWSNSIYGICDDIKTMGEASEGDIRDKTLVAETLQKIPEKIREKVLDEVVFVLMNSLYGEVINGLFSKDITKKELIETPSGTFIVDVRQPLIFLNFGMMKRLSKKRKMNIIAHEIAHFILHHHLDDNAEIKNGIVLHEKEADDLIIKWGFEREYKTYKIKRD